MLRQYGFPGHSVAASPLMSLWQQARSPPPAHSLESRGAPQPRGIVTFSRTRLRCYKALFYCCAALGLLVLVLALAANKLQDPVDELAFVTRCSSLYPQFAAAERQAPPSPLSPPPHPPPRPPRPPHLPSASPWHNATASRPRALHPGHDDFDRQGAQLSFAALVIGVAAFLLPIICGSCCVCDGRRCCSCNGNRSLLALLCQVLGWFAFGVFVANLAQAAAWQATISCGCGGTARAGVSAGADGLFGSGATAFFHDSTSAARSTSSSSSSSSSSSDTAAGGCGGAHQPALLSRLFITTFGALGMFACSMSLGYFWLSTEQTVAAARAAVVHMMPLLPTVRLPLPPIIVAEPYNARGGSGEGGEGGAGGSTVVGMPMGGMVLVEEPGGELCVGSRAHPQPGPAREGPYAPPPPGPAAPPEARSRAAPAGAPRRMDGMLR